MKTKLKKWHILLMSFIALFVTICASMFSLRADTIDDETGEILTDNWELSTVFYDSTVNNGTTPLTEINWDASDGGYERGTSRVITVQINYKNNNAVTTYQPGDLKISMDGILKNMQMINWNGYSPKDLYISWIIGANDATHTGYDWNYSADTIISDGYQCNLRSIVFSNAKTIEEKANLQGSIQIVYTLTPRKEEESATEAIMIERYEDECVHNYSTKLQAQLSYNKLDEQNNVEKIKINSNELSFNYTRTYIHPWQTRSSTITKEATALSSLDGLPAGDYYWVKYKFTMRGYNGTSYPYIGFDYYIEDEFPTECIIVDHNFNQLNITNGIYQNSAFENTSSDVKSNIIYVGYPESIYNEENNNLNITNHVDLYAKYLNAENYFIMDEDDISLNLANFKFVYSGNLYSVTKTSASQSVKYSDFMLDPTFDFHSQSLNTVTNDFAYNISGSAIYTGQPLTVRFGDDLLYITDTNGNYRRLNDNEYYLYSTAVPKLVNGNNATIPYDKYTINLYVRYAEDTDYSFYKKITTSETIIFTKEEKIVGFYYEFLNITESLKINSANNYGSVKYTIKPLGNISESGRVYNFDFLQVFINDELQNEPTIDSYANFITKEEIATFDQETYGTYMQRSSAYYSYSKYTVSSPKITDVYTTKSMSNFVQDAENEMFNGTSKISIGIRGESSPIALLGNFENYKKLYFNYQDQLIGIDRFETYDLLPEGMELTSSNNEMLESMSFSNWPEFFSKFYNLDGSKPFNSQTEFLQHIKNHSTINIINNWKNTNRTKIEWIIDLSDNPLIYIDNNSNSFSWGINFNYSVSYDSYLQYGKTWTNYSYLFAYYANGKNIDTYYSLDNQKIRDTGVNDPLVSDINENGITAEYLNYDNQTKTITSIVSTHQDVTTYVKTDQSNYSTGVVDSSCNTEYEYKLRVRTGAADVTNLVLYTNIEEAQPNRTRWKGTFLDLDTSYAEQKGYIVKPYYSENPKAGNLFDENGLFNNDWKEYVVDTPEIVANGLAITFDENFKTYNSSDYLYIYYYYNGYLYRSAKYYNTMLAGQTIEIPSTDVYFYWHTSSSGNTAYGFKINNIEPKVVTEIIGATSSSLPINVTAKLSGTNYPESNHDPYNNNEEKLWQYTYTDSLILQEFVQGTDKTKIKSLAFEYLDKNGNAAVLPKNSLTYVLIKMKSPSDENITTLARMDCWTQWNAIDEFDRPVDFITGINSNVVKVALPNSVKTDEVPSISLKFTKEIQGTDSEFENLKLNKAAQQTFMIRLTSLTANDDSTYDQVAALLRSDQELIISQIPIGTYLLEELGDNYFDFVEFTDNNNPEIIINGITFERTDQGYIITVSEDLTENIEFNIKVTNEIEPERFYEDKDNKENLFLKTRLIENN